MTTTDSMSKTLDAIRAKRNQSDSGPVLTDEERAEAARVAEDKAYERMEHSADRKAASARHITARRALVGVTTGLKHGVKIDAEDRAALVAEAVEGIGGNASPNVRKTIEQAVDRIADLVADGFKGDAVQVAENAAADVAGLPGRIAAPAKVDPSADEADPAKLADLIPRT
jgi:hypothetical protein